MSDWEISDNDCPKCRAMMRWQECWQCGGEGGRGYEELRYEDPLWYDEDDFELCGECRATGHLEWCAECGWDNVFKQFMTEQYEKEWLEKQAVAVLEEAR